MSIFLSLLPSLLAILAPIVTTGVRKVVPKIPKLLLPLTSVVVGTAGAAASDYLVGTSIGPAGGAVLGAVGVAVREIADQALKALTADE